MSMTEFQRKRAGKRLREFIYRNFVSAKDFGEFVGVHPCTITHWMNGRTPVPRKSIDRLLINFPEDLPVRILRPDIYS